MQLPTKAQVDAVTRHLITIAGTAIAIFGLQAKGITVQQVTDAITSLGAVANSLLVLIAAIGPIYAATRAGQSASPASQVQQVQQIAATQPELAKEAKVALLDATAGLPEVKEPIKVTDPALAEATSSTLVKAA